MSKQANPPPPGDKPVPTAPPKPPTWRNWIWPIMLIAIFALWFLLPTRSPSTSLSYSQFLSDVSAGQVKTVQLASTPGGTSTGTLTNGKSFTVVVPPQAGQELLTELQDNKVQISSAPSGNGFGTEVLIYLITFGLPILIFVWIFRRISRSAGGGLQGALGVGRSRAKVFDEERPSTTFADVAGYEGAKSEIAEVVDFLRSPERYTRVGAMVPRGVLMVGPPGTGKTLLARAVAGEAHVPFFSVTGSGFVELFVGVGASRVRDLFEQARKRAPAIIFIDEVDAIGQRRAGRGRWCPTTSGSRRLISSWRRWTGSSPRRASWCSRPRTGPRSSTRPCSGRAGSTGRSPSRCRTPASAPRSWPCTAGTRS